MSMWQKLATMLGIREDQVEDALQNERGAQKALSRRGFLMGTVAFTASEILPMPKTFALPPFDARVLNADFQKLPPHWRQAILMSGLAMGGMIAYFAMKE